MEKRRINIICMLLMVLLGVAVGKTGLQMGKSISDIRAGNEYTKGKEKVYIKLKPDNNYLFTDTLPCVTSPAGIPYQMTEANLAIERTEAYGILSAIVYIATVPMLLFLLFWAPYAFVCFIRDVKRERIFVRKNVKRLRVMASFLLLVGFMANLLGALDYYYLLKDLSLTIPGYRVILFDFHYSALMAGFVFFLFAEIFSMGVRMKEEQDLIV